MQKEHGYKSYDDYKIKHGLIQTKEQKLAEGAVECVICGCVGHDLTSHITRIHNMTPQEYREKYNSPTRSKKFLNELSERVKGENNPAYQHGGRLSPFSDKFIHADKIDKEELIKKVGKSNRENGNNSTTLLYWLKLGYSEEEAKEKLSERQTTFSLEKCIKKYGEEEGRKRWKKRQEKWLKSLDNLSEKKKEEIRMKKSTGRMIQLFNGDESAKKVSAIVYYIKIYDNENVWYKIGITSKGIKGRFGTKKDFKRKTGFEYVVLDTYEDSFYNCFKLEQKILKQFKNKRIIFESENLKGTEFFNEDILNGKTIKKCIEFLSQKNKVH